MSASTFVQRLVALLGTLLLAACAGTIQRESGAGARRVEGATYTGVEIVLSEDARRAQKDNPLFNARELGEYVRKQLESRDLLNAQGTHRVEVTIEHMRVRSAAAAVLLGVMAGADSIDGHVRVYDARGRQVHGYKVTASYALGGLGGGQDSTRLGWLYAKFAELAVAELAGATPDVAVARGRARPSAATAAGSIAPSPQVAITPPAQPRAEAQVAAAQVPVPAQPRSLASGFAAIDDVDAVPYLSDRGRGEYQKWLKLPTPRAFAIASNGHFWHTSGLKPREPGLPTDPSERALLMCERSAKQPCKLYAVNHAVVWARASD
jgi:hypothetical protein